MRYPRRMEHGEFAQMDSYDFSLMCRTLSSLRRSLESGRSVEKRDRLLVPFQAVSTRQ
jgi:hypothetical protein